MGDKQVESSKLLECCAVLRDLGSPISHLLSLN